MRSNQIKSMMLAVAVALCALSVSAQNAPVSQGDKGVKTDSKMAYHNGPIMSGAADVYVIWYGCWDEICGKGNTATQEIVADFLSNVGGSPYFQINAMYANGSGQAPSGATFFA